MEAAPALLGALLIRRLGDDAVVAARIVETEAYLADDPASHSFCGCTPRNRSMFGRSGLAYVYRIHRSLCLNVVTGPVGRGEAVLVRAVEIVRGAEHATRLRTAASAAKSAPPASALSNGPGKLCQALGVTLDLDGIDLLESGALRLLRGEPVSDVAVSTRIGIRKAADAPLRFYDANSGDVSRRRATH